MFGGSAKPSIKKLTGISGALTQIKIDRLAGKGRTFADIAPRQAGRLRTPQSTGTVLLVSIGSGYAV